MIKGVLFDFDGTLLNTNQSVCEGYRKLFKTFRPDFPISDDFLRSLLGPSLVQIFPKYFKEDNDTLISIYREGANSIKDKEHIKPFNNAIETLKTLKEKGYIVAIVSSRKVSSLIDMANLYDMNKYFDLIIGSDSVSKHKPDPEPILLALSKLNLKNDEVIMVGDHGGDIKAGVSANVKAYGVSYSCYGKDNLLKDGATKVIDDLSEVIDIVEKY